MLVARPSFAALPGAGTGYGLGAIRALSGSVILLAPGATAIGAVPLSAGVLSPVPRPGRPPSPVGRFRVHEFLITPPTGPGAL